MNTLAKKIPGKRLTMIQCLTTLLLVIIICCVCFGTIFSVTLTLDEEVEETFSAVINKLGGDPDEIQIPTEVDVNLIFLVKSVGAGVDTMISVISGRSEKGGTEGMIEDAENILNNKDKILSEDTINFAAFVAAMVQSFKSSLILGICNVMLIIMSFVFPITLVIKGIIAIIGFLCSFYRDWGKAFHRVSKAIHGAISLFPVLFLLMVLVPEIKLGSAVYTVLWLSVTALVLNLVASRLKYYEADDFQYFNILQIVSACSFVGFLMFFFGITGSDIIPALWSGVANLEIESITDIFKNILTVILISMILSGLISLLKFMTDSVTRLACMSKRKSATHIVSTAMGLVTILALVALIFTDFALDLAGGTVAFVIAVLGVVIMFASEIVLKVLPTALCHNVSGKRRKEIVTGAYTYEATLEEASIEEAPVEETPVEEAPVEEAPVEEAPVEETPAEETLVEEAPIEETSVEEVTIEETSVEEVTE